MRRTLAIALMLCFAGFDPAMAFWRTFNDTDMPGGDYRNFEIVPRTNSIAGDGVASRCEEACKGDPRCKAWTAVKPGVQSKNGKCWLKTQVVPQQPSNCCSSGWDVKSTGKPQSGTSAATSTPAPAPVSSPTAGDAVPANWAEMLAAHNEKRKLHCVGALTWSAKLAAEAQEYASKCNLGVHGSTGENLDRAWSMQGNGTAVLPAKSHRDAFQDWYSEVRNYPDYNNPVFVSQGSGVNGHFTQVVWKDSRQLGCGVATCKMEAEVTRNGQTVKQLIDGTQWVCRYLPAGNNNVGNPGVLKDQVKAPAC